MFCQFPNDFINYHLESDRTFVKSKNLLVNFTIFFVGWKSLHTFVKSTNVYFECKLDKHQLPQKKAKVEFHTCRGYRLKNGHYYRFSQENPSSLGSPAAKTEWGARLLDFLLCSMFDHPRKPGTLKKIRSILNSDWFT
jgi:hypothetical protein